MPVLACLVDGKLWVFVVKGFIIFERCQDYYPASPVDPLTVYLSKEKAEEKRQEIIEKAIVDNEESTKIYNSDFVWTDQKRKESRGGYEKDYQIWDIEII